MNPPDPIKKICFGLGHWPIQAPDVYSCLCPIHHCRKEQSGISQRLQLVEAEVTKAGTSGQFREFSTVLTGLFLLCAHWWFAPTLSLPLTQSLALSFTPSPCLTFSPPPSLSPFLSLFFLFCLCAIPLLSPCVHLVYLDRKLFRAGNSCACTVPSTMGPHSWLVFRPYHNK